MKRTLCAKKRTQYVGNKAKCIGANPVAEAYKVLAAIYTAKEPTLEDAMVAIEEAVGFLGEALE